MHWWLELLHYSKVYLSEVQKRWSVLKGQNASATTLRWFTSDTTYFLSTHFPCFQVKFDFIDFFNSFSKDFENLYNLETIEETYSLSNESLPDNSFLNLKSTDIDRKKTSKTNGTLRNVINLKILFSLLHQWAWENLKL